ncbi:MAG: 3-isopropylmalate dehydratase small subunit [Deltaproteobacteria bacterium]|nr:3-isopropylmalate dehydratase small subunit [Deltaproteobacteria bacterium]
MIFRGKIWKFGDNIDTDVIIPARFLNVSDKETLAGNCFVDVRPGFKDGVEPGDIILGGRNFGCGSSREHAPWAIKECGIALVIARSFARIFYRNAFNIGLPLLESEDAWDMFSDGDRVRVDLGTGEIRGEEEGQKARAKAIPDFMMEIVRAGGLVAYIKEKGSF